MKLYLTSARPYNDRFSVLNPTMSRTPGLRECHCYIWSEEPSPQPNGSWWRSDYIATRLSIGRFPEADLAALGFPPPGKMRTIEIGEYKEGE